MKRKEFDMVLATINISADWISEQLKDPCLADDHRMELGMNLWALEESLEILESHREMGVIE